MSIRHRKVLRVFLASPGDLDIERAVVARIIDELNLAWGEHFGVLLELIRWETHAVPGVGVDAQDVVNSWIPADYEVFIGLMWRRFGTPTSRAGSGTAEEFERAYEISRSNPGRIHIMFYFKAFKATDPEAGSEQAHMVEEFRERIGSRGALSWTFSDPDQLAALLRLHLARILQRGQPNNLLNGEAFETSSFDSETEQLQDAVVHVQKSSEKLASIVGQIGQAMAMSGEAFRQRRREIDQLVSAGKVDKRNIQLWVRRVVGDIDNFIARTQRATPRFAAEINSMLTTTSRVAPFSYYDHPLMNRSRRQLLSSLSLVRERLVSLATMMSQMKDVAGAMPLLTPSLESGVRRLNASADILFTEYSIAAELAEETVKVYQQFEKA